MKIYNLAGVEMLTQRSVRAILSGGEMCKEGYVGEQARLEKLVLVTYVANTCRGGSWAEEGEGEGVGPGRGLRAAWHFHPVTTSNRRLRK